MPALAASAAPMQTTHRVLTGDARRLHSVADASVALVVTSPPYPMIAMWDDVFAAMNPSVKADLERAPARAFEAQHATLDAVWAECHRVLLPGGILCVNIGDATRTLAGEFRLWSNHGRVLRACEALGFSILPDILWRKPTNAPNKFMGSGMLPGGAYVTYEHEYVLVLRKGGLRVFTGDDSRRARRESAYFWEERNVWFSDLWSDLLGAGQAMTRAPDLRERSAAFPLELPSRLVHMYSVYGDTVLDPFAGTGTTLLAAACAGRNSVGVELEAAFAERIHARVAAAPTLGRAAARMAAHRRFVAERLAAGKTLAHHNGPHDVPVITGQERDLCLYEPVDARVLEGRVEMGYVKAG
ncbi:MAG: site-specific DNA-methyltransferase [Pseudomonadota bacterium]|nr:site-specific DNA-methyltransferase [Pseudomonadota bacterium]